MRKGDWGCDSHVNQAIARIFSLIPMSIGVKMLFGQGSRYGLLAK